MSKKQKKMLTRIMAAAFGVILLNFVPVTGILRFTLYLAVYLVIGYDILKKAGRGILNRRMFDENFLMAVATIGAFALAVYSKSGDYNEAIAVMLFYQIGELFQSYAVGKSRRNISALMDIRPDYANVECDGKLEKRDPDEVGIGSIIVVQPGEKVPLDGIVVEGSSSLNTSALTGESLPRDVRQGEEVISGCINMTGVLKVRTTKQFEESTVSKILELVENSGSRKSKSEHFISKFAKVYTPAVCYGALALALLPPVIEMVFLGQAAQWGVWIYRALTFLVISCPCALVISIPLSFFAGIGGASKAGVLIKGSNYMETLSQTKYVMFDKTGTLTKAEPTVLDIVSFNGMKCKELLRIAACLEEHFPHSMAKDVVQAAVDRNLVHEELHSEVEYIVAHGISSMIENKKVGKRTVIGSYHFVFEDEQCTIPEGKEELFEKLPEECSHLYMAIEGKLAGVICIEDPLREEAKDVIKALKAAGIKKVVMMTGDSDRTAKVIAAKVGVDEYHAEVLPEDKAAFVEKEKAEGRKVIMIGDGINDSPALSASNVGIAISDGAQIAREIADITISEENLYQLVTLKAISNGLMKRIHGNYRFVIGFNLGLILLGVAGVIAPATSALLHNTSTLGISLKSMTNLLNEQEKRKEYEEAEA